MFIQSRIRAIQYFTSRSVNKQNRKGNINQDLLVNLSPWVGHTSGKLIKNFELSSSNSSVVVHVYVHPHILIRFRSITDTCACVCYFPPHQRVSGAGSGGLKLTSPTPAAAAAVWFEFSKGWGFLPSFPQCRGLLNLTFSEAVIGGNYCLVICHFWELYLLYKKTFI